MQCKIAKKIRLRRARCFFTRKTSILPRAAKKTLHMENHEKKRCFRVSSNFRIPFLIDLYCQTLTIYWHGGREL